MMFLSKGMKKYKVHEATYTHMHACTLCHTRTGYCILVAGFTLYQTQWVATTEEVLFKDVLCQQTELNPMCHGVTTCQGVTLINTLTQKKRCCNLMPLPNVVSFWLYHHKYQTTVNSRDTPFKVALICVHIFSVSTWGHLFIYCGKTHFKMRSYPMFYNMLFFNEQCYEHMSWLNITHL